MFPTIPFLGWDVAAFGLILALQAVQIGLLVLAISRQGRQQPAIQPQARIHDGKHRARRTMDDSRGNRGTLRSVAGNSQPLAEDRRVA